MQGGMEVYLFFNRLIYCFYFGKDNALKIYYKNSDYEGGVAK
jgi:hypothetical protein